MQTTMTKHGITVKHNSNGTWTVSGKIGNNKWSETVKTFCEAGEIAHEMADNNDQGNAINHRMCEVFRRQFFNPIF